MKRHIEINVEGHWCSESCQYLEHDYNGTTCTLFHEGISYEGIQNDNVKCERCDLCLDVTPSAKEIGGSMQEATKLEYLTWFRLHADFGPADGDVKYYMDKDFEAETGKLVPQGWRREDGD